MNVKDMKWYIREEVHTMEAQEAIIKELEEADLLKAELRRGQDQIKQLAIAYGKLQSTQREVNMKIFEVRDRATLMPTLALKFNAANENEKWLLMTAGYGYSAEDQGEYILVGPIDGGHGDMTTDPFEHRSREMREAHLYIRDHWTELDHGAVIDLEFLRGEKDKPAISDRINFFGRP